MPPVTRSKRRSARLSGVSAARPSSARAKRMRTSGRATPRKRMRRNPPASSAEHASSEPSSLERGKLQTRLLDLPDEAISLIFFHLGATDTGGSFAAPRHAFSLAQTNTRLMYMFFSQLTSITPNIANSHPPTLHPTHMFSIILRIRHFLRELYLPKSCHHILQFLHILCPRIEKLGVQDVDEDSGFQPATILRLPLRSLSIRCPTKNTLRLLTPSMPEELSLIKVSEKHVPDHLAPILQRPPKRFHLEIRTLRPDKLLKLVTHLQDACPKIEELTVKFHDRITYDEVFIPMATFYLSAPRPNTESKCRKLVLEGALFELVRHAHPEAVVELSRGFQTFVNDGNKIYAKSIRLLDAYLTQDLTNVTEIAVEDRCNPQWADVLTDKYFSRVMVTSIETMTYLCLNVKVVDLSIKTFVRTMCSNWGWLDGVSEVRLTNPTDMKTSSDKVNFIESVGNLLDQFRGNLVWIRVFFKFRLNKKNSVLRRKVTYLARALDGFEAAGGDAGTVRAIVQRIKWR